MVYELERDGRRVYCNSYDVVSVLLATGWTMRDTDHWARLVQELAPGSPPATPSPADH
jgi:hypothetical protein